MTTLTMGSLRYDQFQGIGDGRVTMEGFDIQHTTSTIASEIFQRMMRDRAFDVSELGLT